MTFLVWNPARGLPTYAHDSLESACREAVRLRSQHGGNFYIMAPLIDEEEMWRAAAFSRGKNEGLAEARRQIMLAEGNADRLSDERVELRNKLSRVEKWLFKAKGFQSIVADALLWFDGFSAAHAHQSEWERPTIPERHKLRELNSALLDLVPSSEYDDDQIPF